MRQMRAAFYTLGCKVNQYESFALMDAFAKAGFELTDPGEQADVYVVNSCTVTATGDKKSRQALRRFRRQSPDAVLVLTGCYPQASPQEAAALPEADIVTGSKNRRQLLAQVQAHLNAKASTASKIKPDKLVAIEDHLPGEPFEPLTAGEFGSRTRAFLKIQDGCERRCSYCIIPDARGPMRSKPPQDLADELSAIAAAGYKEVVLVGINLSSYGLERGSHKADYNLTTAIELACNTPGIARVRLGSLEPELITRADIAAWARQHKLCPQFHLSLQSGSDTVLARMRRQYNTAQYREITAWLWEHFPGCALTTDVMVAFPGETEEEYAQSEAFVREIGFARAHVFVYSPRPGTPAAQMTGQVPKAVGQDRAKRMAKAAASCRKAYLQAQIDAVPRQTVLFEDLDESGRWQGYTPSYTPVHLSSGEDLAGQLREVELTAISGDGCAARLL